jgi:carboxyl-terminal processing protease
VKRSWRLAILLLLTSSLLTSSLLACQIAPRLVAWGQPVLTATPTFAQQEHKSQPVSRKTLTPSATPTAAATATPLPPAPTATVQPSATATEETHLTATPLPESLQLSIFEDLWTTIKEEYLYEDFNGLDWDEIHVEYRQRIQAGLTNAEFYAAMDEMVMRLGDDHSVFLSPELVIEEEAEYQGNYDFVGIGVMLSPVPDRQRAVILVTFPGSPAEASGLQPRDNLIAVNGEPILDEYGFLRDIVRGPEGTLVTLTLQTPGEAPRQVTIERKRISSSLPVPYSILISSQGKRIGYLLVTSFADIGIDEQIGEALRRMTEEAPLDGLIIDNTQNGGGSDTVLRPSLGYFTQGTLGYFISRDEERPLEIKKAEEIPGMHSLPLVVLVSLDTVSYGEVFAGVLQDVGRAYLIGETTDGNVETLWGYDFEDGSRAWIAHESFRPLNHPEQNWEETGIIPDLTILANWDEYTTRADPRVRVALDYFDNP